MIAPAYVTARNSWTYSTLHIYARHSNGSAKATTFLPLRLPAYTYVPVEGDGGDDVARAQAAVDEAGGEAPHAVDELRAGEPSAAWAGSGDGGVAAAGEDPA